MKRPARARKFRGPHGQYILYATKDTGEDPRRMEVIVRDEKGGATLVGSITEHGKDYWQVHRRGGFKTQYSAAEYLILWVAFGSATGCPWCGHPWRVTKTEDEKDGSGTAMMVCDACKAEQTITIYPPPGEAKCDNCEKVWAREELEDVADYDQRVDEEEPAGQCPECGALCYWLPDPADIEADQWDIDVAEATGKRPRSR